MGNRVSKNGSKRAKEILLKRGKKASKQDVKELWNIFDKDGNGKLGISEFRELQHMRVELFKERDIWRVSQDEAAKRAIEDEAKRLKDTSGELWYDMDLNRDGNVSYDEFALAVYDAILTSPFEMIIRNSKRRNIDVGRMESSPSFISGSDMPVGSRKDAARFRSMQGLPRSTTASSRSLNGLDALTGTVDEGVEGGASGHNLVHTDGKAHVMIHGGRGPPAEAKRHKRLLSQDVKTVTNTVVRLAPNEWEGLLISSQDRKTGVVTIKFKFGVCYAHHSNVTLLLEQHSPAEYKPNPMLPWGHKALAGRGLGGVQFYQKVALGCLQKEDIDHLSEDEMSVLLPWLITLKKAPLREAVETWLKKSARLRRCGWWLRMSEFDTAHGAYLFRQHQPAGTINSRSFFTSTLTNRCETGDEHQGLRVYVPIWPKWDVSDIKVVRKFSSGHAPSLLECTLQGLPNMKQLLMFKPDDIRSDFCVLQVFRLLNIIWKQTPPLHHTFTPHAFIYDICPMSPGGRSEAGVMEFVNNAEQLSSWDASVLQTLSPQRQTKFIETCAGSYVSTYICGCRDRHFDNFMVKNNDTFLQIDFKRCFNFAARGPVDAPHFAIKKDMKAQLEKMKYSISALDQDGISRLKEYNGWDIFRQLCYHAIMALRAKGEAVVKMVAGMFTGISKIEYFSSQQHMQGWVIETLGLRYTSDELRKELYKTIDSGLNSKTKLIKNTLHQVNVTGIMRKAKAPEAKVFKADAVPTTIQKRRSSIVSASALSSVASTLNGALPEGIAKFNAERRNVAPVSRLGASTSTLDFSRQARHDGMVKEVYAHIKSHKNLGKLDVSFNSFALSGTKLILSALQFNTTLVELSLAGIFFGPQGAETLAKFVSGNGVLTTLDIRQCRICHKKKYKGFKKLCDAISSPGCGLLALDVSSNALKTRGLAMLCEATQENFLLEHIIFDDNDFIPTDSNSQQIEMNLLRNREGKFSITTISKVIGLDLDEGVQLYAKICVPFKDPIKTHTVIYDSTMANFDYNVKIEWQEQEVPVRIEIWQKRGHGLREDKRLSSTKVPIADISPHAFGPAAAASRADTKSVSSNGRPGSGAQGDAKSERSRLRKKLRRLRTRGGSMHSLIEDMRGRTERRYNIKPEGILVLRVHTGQLLDGGVTFAEAKYMYKDDKSRYRSSTAPKEDVTDKLKKATKSGFLILEDGANLEALLEDDDNSNEGESFLEALMLHDDYQERDFKELTIKYRIGHIERSFTTPVPIPKFTRLFVGFKPEWKPQAGMTNRGKSAASKAGTASGIVADDATAATSDSKATGNQSVAEKQKKHKKNLTQSDLVKAMCEDTHRRSIMYSESTEAAIADAIADVKREEQQSIFTEGLSSPLPTRAKTADLAAIKEKKAWSESGRPRSFTSGRPLKKPSTTDRASSAVGKAQKLNRIYFVMEVFNLLDPKRKRILDRRQIKMLLKFTGDRLPVSSVADFISEAARRNKDSITFNELRQWIETRHISAFDLQSMLQDIKNAGAEKKRILAERAQTSAQAGESEQTEVSETKSARLSRVAPHLSEKHRSSTMSAASQISVFPPSRLGSLREAYSASSLVESPDVVSGTSSRTADSKGSVSPTVLEEPRETPAARTAPANASSSVAAPASATEPPQAADAGMKLDAASSPPRPAITVQYMSPPKGPPGRRRRSLPPTSGGATGDTARKQERQSTPGSTKQPNGTAQISTASASSDSVNGTTEGDTPLAPRGTPDPTTEESTPPPVASDTADGTTERDTPLSPRDTPNAATEGSVPPPAASDSASGTSASAAPPAASDAARPAAKRVNGTPLPRVQLRPSRPADTLGDLDAAVDLALSGRRTERKQGKKGRRTGAKKGSATAKKKVGGGLKSGATKAKTKTKSKTKAKTAGNSLSASGRLGLPRVASLQPSLAKTKKSRVPETKSTAARRRRVSKSSATGKTKKKGKKTAVAKNRGNVA